MTSVVGSPHYVAPEIVSQATTEDEDDFSRSSMQSGRVKKTGAIQHRKSSDDVAKVGYDGTKADVWSAGVILYAMLFRSLPFGEDLFRCPRFIAFNNWYKQARAKTDSRRASGLASLDPFYTIEDENMLGPPWFFPQKTSRQSRDLIVAMLNPDPGERLSIEMVSRHPWLTSTTIQHYQGG
jgi:BR serine/threonine kinase